MRRWRVLWVLVLGCVTVAVIFVPSPGVVDRLTGVAEHHSTPHGATVVTDKSVGKVRLKVGDELQVRLGTNGGYDWLVAPVVNPILVRQGVGGYVELHPTDGEVRVGDVEVYHFKAVKAGQQDLQFEFCGPRDKGASAKRAAFSVIVQ